MVSPTSRALAVEADKGGGAARAGPFLGYVEVAEAV